MAGTEGGEAEMFKVSIEDTGIGISREAQANLFQLFGRLEENKEDNRTGCGLGLTIC